MNRPQFNLPPTIFLYGADTFLGNSLASFWQARKIPVIKVNPDIAEDLTGHRGRFKVVFIAGESRDSLEQVALIKKLFELAPDHLITFTLITNLRSSETDLFLEKTVQEKLPLGKWQIIRVPKIYGPKAPVRSLGILGEYLRNLNQKEPLLVPGDGLKKVPLLHISDAVSIIDEIVFKADGRIFPIVPPDILTELELAYLIRSLSGQGTTVVFGTSREGVEISLNLSGLRNLELVNRHPAVPLREGLRPILTSLNETQQKPVPPARQEIKPVNNKIPAPQKKPRGKGLTLSVAVVLLAVIVGSYFALWGPLAATAYFGLVGKNKLAETVSNLKDMDVSAAEISATDAGNALASALDNAQKLPALPPLNRATEFLQGGKYLADSLATLMGVGKVFLGKDPSETAITDSLPKIKEAYDSLVLADLDLEAAGGVDTTIIRGVLPTLKVVSKLAPALPRLLGFDSPKTYLVLFQNPTELRPTGGFIGSYAKVTLNRGQVTNLILDDIYNPDGQLLQKDLGGPVPPDMAAAIPNLKKLYIRDANWWISYPESASHIASLYKAATGVEISGVAAIDLHLVKDLLDITGPVYLGSYDQTITAGNLYEEAEANAESNYFDGSPQKKNFLQLLGTKLLDQINNLSGNQKISLLGIINTNLTEKHVLLSSFDDTVSSVLAENKWDGAVFQNPGQDFLMVVDTNIGGNKANYSVRRNIEYDVKNTYRDGTLEGTLTISYQNTSQAGSWPDGTYQNYLRVLVPKGSFLNDATVETLPAPSDSSGVKTGEDNNFTIFSYSFSLSPEKSLVLKLHYTLPKELNLNPTTKTYQLQVVKQPGTEGDPFIFRIATPFGRALTLPVGYKTEADGISFGTLLQTDLDLQIPLN